MSNPAPRPGSEEEWEELLHQLRARGKGQPRPFFYERVHARLTTELATAGAWLPAWARWPAYLALLGGLMLAVSGDGAALRPAIALHAYPSLQPPALPPSPGS